MKDSAVEDRAGQLVAGRYRLTRAIGEGAFGVVWLSEQLPAGPPVVIKLLNPQWSRSPEIVARFRREAIASTRVNHPNVCHIYEFGSTDDGTPFIAMEYLSGGTLKAELDRTGAMPIARVASLMVPVCQAVAMAHQAEIVHRDLKPENVMLSVRDGALTPVVLDFGIAKLLDATEKLTQTGSMLGTPAYMSPEQCQGKSNIGPGADVYSLAVMIHELLVGAPPFEADTLAAMAMKHVLEPPPQLGGVPAALTDVVSRALAKEPLARPSAAALARGLQEAAQLAPGALAHAIEIPEEQKLNPGGSSQRRRSAQQPVAQAAARPAVADSHDVATVISVNAGREVQALVQAAQQRAVSQRPAQRPLARQPARSASPLPLPLMIGGLVALAGLGALLGWLLQR